MRNITIPAISASVLICASLLQAEEIKIPEGMTPQQFQVLYMDGGYIYKPGTGHGAFLFINSQRRVSLKDLEQVREKIANEIWVEVKFSTSNETAEITTEIVDIPKMPRLAIYPDDKKAVVNVAALAVDNPSAELLASRVRKEMLRAFTYLAGITGGGKAGHPLDVMTDLKRLDESKEMISGDLVVRFTDFIQRSGIKPYKRYTYRKACEEGWAPPPANKYQQAIWDKVRATPKNPMKIKFDPKKRR